MKSGTRSATNFVFDPAGQEAVPETPGYVVADANYERGPRILVPYHILGNGTIGTWPNAQRFKPTHYRPFPVVDRGPLKVQYRERLETNIMQEIKCAEEHF
jgi:hypothetical protein